MKNIGIRLAVLSILAGSCSAMAGAQIDPNRVVAVINGEEIKATEYYRRMEYLPEIGKPVNNGFIESTPGFWTLERIITEKLIIALAKQKSVYPTATEIQNEIKMRLADSTVLSTWVESGQTKEELEYQILIQLCQFKIATMGVNVTDLEVEKFYKDYPSMFTTPKKHRLRVITSTDATKQAQIDLQLQSGKPFAEVAKAMSEDKSKADGGLFGIVDLTRVNEVMRKAIEPLKVGGMTAWLDTGTQKLKFFVEEIIPAQLQKLDEDTRRSIRRRIMLDRGRVKNDVPKIMAEARKAMKIDIKAKDLATEYERVMKLLPTSPGGGTP